MFEIIEENEAGVKLLKNFLFKDMRGTFCKTFSEKDFLKNGFLFQPKENFYSISKKFVLRGMHFQISPNAECKIIKCIKGSVFDVAIDLRKTSSSFGDWIGIELSSVKNNAIVIPEGFAHGFQTMTSNCEMLYLHTEDYNKSSEGAINALDPMINIKWPKPITMRSTRDISHAMLTENFKGIEL